MGAEIAVCSQINTKQVNVNIFFDSSHPFVLYQYSTLTVCQ